MCRGGLRNVLHHITAALLHYSFLSVTVIKREPQSVAVTARDLKQPLRRQPVGNRCATALNDGNGDVRAAAVLMRSKYL